MRVVDVRFCVLLVVLAQVVVVAAVVQVISLDYRIWLPIGEDLRATYCVESLNGG